MTKRPTTILIHVASCALFFAFGLFFAAIVIFDQATIENALTAWGIW